MNHRFDEGCCLNCGAFDHDCLHGQIGCDAEVTNASGYLGLALTRREQRLNLTTIDKARFIFAEMPDMSCTEDEFLDRLSDWDEMVDQLDVLAISL